MVAIGKVLRPPRPKLPFLILDILQNSEFDTRSVRAKLIDAGVRKSRVAVSHSLGQLEEEGLIETREDEENLGGYSFPPKIHKITDAGLNALRNSKSPKMD